MLWNSLVDAAKEKSPVEGGSSLPLVVGEDFEIVEKIGAGGMGIIYRARQISKDREVALKILPGGDSDRNSINRFEREAQILASLDHPHIVRIWEKGRDDDIYFFAMELVKGGNLAELLEEEPLSDREKIDLLLQICGALEYAHSQGIVHRDIKPANILIDGNRWAKISDFGLSRLWEGVDSSFELTRSQTALGTLKYMSPEQRKDSRHVDYRSDIYSLGVMIYEVLTGEEPLGRFELPSEVDDSLDSRFDRLIDGCLRPRPEDRFESVGEVIAILEKIKNGEGEVEVDSDESSRRAPFLLSTFPPSSFLDKTLVLFAHVCGFIPLANFLVPLGIWHWRGKKSDFVHYHCQSILNFQLSSLLYFFLSLLLIPLYIGLFLLPLVAIYYVLSVLVGLSRAAGGERYRNALAFEFLGRS